MKKMKINNFNSTEIKRRLKLLMKGMKRKYVCKDCGRIFGFIHSFRVHKGLERRAKGIGKEKIVFHGTGRIGAAEILKTGFQPYTYFASHLEDALEFGDSWVFSVRLKDTPSEWQFRNEKKIPPSKIKRLTHYRPVVKYGTQECLTRKVDSARERKNLLNPPREGS